MVAAENQWMGSEQGFKYTIITIIHQDNLEVVANLGTSRLTPIDETRRGPQIDSVESFSTMNNLARHFTSSCSLSTKKVRSLATANCGATSAVGFPLSIERRDTHQYRNFGSLISSHNKLSSVHGNVIQTTSTLISSPLSFSSIGKFSSSDATTTTTESKKDESTDTDALSEEIQQQVLSPTSPTVVTDSESGEKFGILLDTRKLPKLKPSVVRRRLANCRIYEGRERSIRQSPWKLNRICQLSAGLTLEEALTQLKFCDLKNADLVAKVLKRTSNLADIRDGLQISQLEVKECFATKSLMLRRIKPMGRGRYVDSNLHSNGSIFSLSSWL